jgi:recombinational DNA repair protein RecT
MDPDRKVKGAVGYIEYEDSDLNEVITIHTGDIEKAKNFAKSQTFWDGHYEAMVLKTIAHRACSNVDLDPKLVTDSVRRIAEQENPFIPDEEKRDMDVTDYAMASKPDLSEPEQPATKEEATHPEPDKEIEAPKQGSDIDRDLEEQANAVATGESDNELPFR